MEKLNKESNYTARSRIVRAIELLSDRSRRLFAADCADEVLYLLGSDLSPVGKKVALAIKDTRDFANDLIDQSQLKSTSQMAERASRWFSPDGGARYAAMAAVRCSGDYDSYYVVMHTVDAAVKAIVKSEMPLYVKDQKDTLWDTDFKAAWNAAAEIGYEKMIEVLREY